MQREREWAIIIALGMRGDSGMYWGSGSRGGGKSADLRDTIGAG